MATLLADIRQTRSSNRLPVALVLLIRDMERDLPGKFWKLHFQNLFRAREDDVATLSRGDPAQNQHMAQIVEIREMRDAVTEVHADGLVNFPRPFIALFHER